MPPQSDPADRPHAGVVPVRLPPEPAPKPGGNDERRPHPRRHDRRRPGDRRPAARPRAAEAAGSRPRGDRAPLRGSRPARPRSAPRAPRRREPERRLDRRDGHPRAGPGRRLGRRRDGRRGPVPAGAAALVRVAHPGPRPAGTGRRPAQPAAGETCTAARGQGAFRNGEVLVPSAKQDLGVALLGTSHPPTVAREPEAVEAAGRSLSALLPHVGAVRNLGPTSWQIADTAAGRMDGFWQFGTDDTNLLGPALVATEAGLTVTDLDGRPGPPVHAASSPRPRRCTT
ncbi:inositol monophosphatase family protein [Streptacidiphilus monticola]